MICDMIFHLHKVFIGLAWISQRVACCLHMISACDVAACKHRLLLNSGAGTDTFTFLPAEAAHRFRIVGLQDKVVLSTAGAEQRCWLRHTHTHTHKHTSNCIACIPPLSCCQARTWQALLVQKCRAGADRHTSSCIACTPPFCVVVLHCGSEGRDTIRHGHVQHSWCRRLALASQTYTPIASLA